LRPAKGTRCAQSLYPQFQRDKARPVVACWPVAQSSGAQVAIVEFARRLSHALASLVLIDGNRRAYIDYPADFKGPGADLWRVDDGGEIHAEAFEVVALLMRGSTYVLAVEWRGAEGSALSLWTNDGDSQLKEVTTDYWYRSPL
jgi:hypothetical protein